MSSRPRPALGDPSLALGLLLSRVLLLLGAEGLLAGAEGLVPLDHRVGVDRVGLGLVDRINPLRPGVGPEPGHVARLRVGPPAAPAVAVIAPADNSRTGRRRSARPIG